MVIIIIRCEGGWCAVFACCWGSVLRGEILHDGRLIAFSFCLSSCHVRLSGKVHTVLDWLGSQPALSCLQQEQPSLEPLVQVS